MALSVLPSLPLFHYNTPSIHRTDTSNPFINNVFWRRFCFASVFLLVVVFAPVFLVHFSRKTLLFLRRHVRAHIHTHAHCTVCASVCSCRSGWLYYDRRYTKTRPGVTPQYVCVCVCVCVCACVMVTSASQALYTHVCTELQRTVLPPDGTIMALGLKTGYTGRVMANRFT